jgi:Tol biopolymer transport system component
MSKKKQKDKDDALVVDEGFRFSRLWTIEIASRAAKEIVKENLVLSDPQFSVDGGTISFTANPTTKADDGSLSDIYLVKSDGSAKPAKLLENPGADSGARWSPDGKWISYGSREATGGLPKFSRLYVRPAQGGQARQLATSFDGPISAVVWSKDSSILYFAAVDRTVGQILAVALSSGAVKPVSSGAGVIGSFALSPVAGKIAFTRSAIDEAPDLFVSDLNPSRP